MLSFIAVLIGGLVVLPVERVWAVDSDYGPDGYFSTLSAGEMPMRTITSEANARKVLFGKSGASMVNPEAAGGGTAKIDGKYLVLGKGPNTNSLNRSPKSASTDEKGLWSKTTLLADNEVLLLADDVMTRGFAFDSNSSPWTNTFDAVSGYESKVAKVSKELDSETYYSMFERDVFGPASRLNAVCIRESGCYGGFDATDETGQSESIGSYRVFPLSIGDMAEYFNASDGAVSADDAKRRCSGGVCNNSASSYWLRSARWDYTSIGFYVSSSGFPSYYSTSDTAQGFRPALRLSLDNLLLSANSNNQGQSGVGDLRLTFVESGEQLDEWFASVSGDAGSRELNLSGSSGYGNVLGWKIVDPELGVVLGSGRTSAGGNVSLPEAAMTDESKAYDLYVWGQEDGSAVEGWTNKATEPEKTTITGWQVKGVTGTDVSGEVESEVVVTLPAAFVLDGAKAGDDSRWVGNNANLAIDVAGVAEEEQVVVRIAAQDGDPSLAIVSGQRSLAYELRVNQSDSMSEHNGSELVVSSGESVAATLQARFIDGAVPSNAGAGDYAGTLNFQIVIEDTP
jgi:hypothetical protein